MSQVTIYTNIDHANYIGWIDPNGKEWESRQRIERIIEGILSMDKGYFPIAVENYSEIELLGYITEVHDPLMVAAIRDASYVVSPESTVFTDFDRHSDAGDSPIGIHTYEALMHATYSAVLAAQALKNQSGTLSVAISRPPGHHAGREYYHGFCFFNTAAVAANILKKNGKVAILDIDAHHGDGTQDIFYTDPDVLYVSLHADPNIVFPHTGRENEVGSGSGLGTTINMPFSIGISANEYKKKLQIALEAIQGYGADFLILSAGFDTHVEEFAGLPPLTLLDGPDYLQIGKQIGGVHIPTCIILEGGYNHDSLVSSFQQLLQGVDSELTVL